MFKKIWYEPKLMNNLWKVSQFGYSKTNTERSLDMEISQHFKVLSDLNKLLDISN